MILRGAKHQRLFLLVDLVHKQVHAVRFALFDLDDLVEVGFRVSFPDFNVALHDLVIRRIDILVKRRRNLPDAEWREETIIDALLERVDIDRLAEVSIRVHVVLALGCCRQAELNGGSEVFENVAPRAFVVRSAAMALVDNDEVEEIRRIYTRRFVRHAEVPT